MSERTKYQKGLTIFLGIFSFVITYLPLIIAVIMGFANGDIETRNKVVLGLTVIVAVIFAIFTFLFKHRIRSTLWILLLGCYIALDNMLWLIVTLAVCTMLDEFVIHPLYKKYKNLYTINKELDKRL